MKIDYHNLYVKFWMSGFLSACCTSSASPSADMFPLSGSQRRSGNVLVTANKQSGLVRKEEGILSSTNMGDASRLLSVLNVLSKTQSLDEGETNAAVVIDNGSGTAEPTTAAWYSKLQ